MAVYKKVPGCETVNISTLEFDTTPTPGSLNPVTSGGVATVSENVAQAFSASSTYAIGEVVIGPDGKLYQCTTAVETAEDWNPAHWTQTTVDEMVGAISDTIPEGASSTNKLVTEADLNEATAAWNEGYTPKGPASVSTLNGLSGQENGDRYVLTNGGTLSAGSVVVAVGDEVAWDGTGEKWYLVNQYGLKSVQDKNVEDIDSVSKAVERYFISSESDLKYHYLTLTRNFSAGDKISVVIGNSSDSSFTAVQLVVGGSSVKNLSTTSVNEYTFAASATYVSVVFAYPSATTATNEAYIGIVKDGSVEYDVRKLYNNFDKSRDYKAVPGVSVEGALLQKNGTTASTSVWDVSDFVYLPFVAGTKFNVACTIYSYGSICFYDKDKNVVFSFNGNDASSQGYTANSYVQSREFTMQASWKYVRFCVFTDNNAMTDTFVSSADYGWGKDVSAQYVRLKQSYEENCPFFEKNLKNKKVLVIGDSISQKSYQNYNKWNDFLKSMGFFGDDYVNSSQHATGFVANTSGNSTCTSRLKAVQNPSTFDFVIVFCGINDFIQSIPFGQSGGDASTEFVPAVEDFFSYLVKNFINARIVVLTPLRTYNTYPNEVGKIQQEYSAVIRDTAKYYSLPLLDLTNESGFCPYITEFKDAWTLNPSGYSVHDGVHPNLEYGRDFLAPMIMRYLQKFI